MSSVLKNKKKKEEAVKQLQQQQQQLEEDSEGSLSSEYEEEQPQKKRKLTKEKAASKTNSNNNGGRSLRRKGGKGEEDGGVEVQPLLDPSAASAGEVQHAELKITDKGTIEGEGESSPDSTPALGLDNHVSQAGEGEVVGVVPLPGGEGAEFTARGTKRMKRYIKRRVRRYLSLELKVAVFERIVRDIDPKTRKLRYGASNEICGEFSIGRKTINNIKNLFERLMKDGKDLSPLLSKEVMEEIPSKLNIVPVVSGQGKQLTAEQLQAIGGGGDDDDSEDEDEGGGVGGGKTHLPVTSTTSSSAKPPATSTTTTSSAAIVADDEGDNEKANYGEDGEMEDGESSRHLKILCDDDLQMRRMFKVTVGRQTKLNEQTVDRIRTIVPYCYGVKELSDMYEREYGEKIHQSTLWRYCNDLGIKIPRKNAKK